MKHIRLVNILEYNKTLYSVFFVVGNFFMRILKFIIIPDDKIILFVSLGGRNFSDSPRAIYDKMIEDPRFDDMKFVWAFINPSKYELKRGKSIKIDSFNYFVTALKARVWITNSSVERGLSFKGKHTFYLNTWHGTPIKRMGSDVSAKYGGFLTKSDNKTDIETAQSEFEAKIFSKAFGLQMDKIKIVGYPRNDELVACTDEKRSGIRKKLNIPSNKKVILYAPTYREYDRDSDQSCLLTSPINVNKWQSELGDEYLLLIRAHYEVTKMMSVEDNEFVRNVSDYPSLNELMLASDMLVSDYSSIIFDYSIQDKPILTFCYDYDKYSKERGMYFDVREELHSNNQDEDTLIKSIKTLDFESAIYVTRGFRSKYVTEYGRASICVNNIVSEELNYTDTKQ